MCCYYLYFWKKYTARFTFETEYDKINQSICLNLLSLSVAFSLTIHRVPVKNHFMIHFLFGI